MSVGNATQALNFDRQDLTLVLGENLDLGGDGSRNGTGKTTIINALSYALYGQALTNIRRDNLINKTNGKNMLVSLDFDLNGQNYKIERGRKPNILRLFVNDREQECLDQDESQGDSRETQQAIEQILGMSHDMFKHVVALNTYTEPFLSLKANEQRSIIEQLLGITLLSEKADRIKELAKQTRDTMREEELRIAAVTKANEKIQEQIDALHKRQTLWIKTQQKEIQDLAAAIEDLTHINIEQELVNHRQLEIYNNNRKLLSDSESWMKKITLAKDREQKNYEKLTQDIASLRQHRCHACGQELHDHVHEQQLQEKTLALQESQQAIAGYEKDYDEKLKIINQIGQLGAAPLVFYDTLELALAHRNNLENLQKDLDRRNSEIDPYQEQIDALKEQALQAVDYEFMNELNRLAEHQEFLLKLLTNKDSFIRKKIIDQNLSYLNSRLGYYLDRIGLPHTVIFQNDLTVEITELGRDLDFDNLSRGERNRLILSMSWAFRDVWESLYHPINLLFIDELVDSGMDTQGVENSLALLKKMSRERRKSIWLVSHRDELAGRVGNIMKVIKENGFTNYNTDIELA